MASKLIRWSGLTVLVGALFQLIIGIIGTAADYFPDPSQASGFGKVWIPLAGFLRPLLTFAPAEEVYHMYDGLWMAAMPALIAGLVGLFHARRLTGFRRGKLEWAGFLISAVGLTVLLIGNGIEAWGLSTDPDVLGILFITMQLPGLFLICIGSTVLGAALLRAQLPLTGRERVAAWVLLVGGFPLGVVFGIMVVGHLFGLLTLYDVAWALIGFSLWRGTVSTQQDSRSVPSPSGSPAR